MKKNKPRPGSKGGRRGRPRENRPEKFDPTPEQIARKALWGLGPNDPDDPITIMVRNGIITTDEESAAGWFEMLHKFRHGSVHPKGVMTEPTGGSDYDSEPKTQRWHEVTQALTRSQRDALENVIVYQRTPLWLAERVKLKTYRASRRRNHFMEGLAVLVQVWTGQRRAA